MKPAPFILHRPDSLAEALALMAEHGEDGGLVLAGGQSLMPMMALRVAYPTHLVDINGIAELAQLDVDHERMRIGATVRHARFHHPVAPGPLSGLLRNTVHNIAHYPIRMRGTFCGSLAHADPASEWCLIATTLGAQLVLASTEGERVLAAEDFIDGAMSTLRAPTEILVRAELEQLAQDASTGFYEFNRRSGDFALGMAAVCYRRDGTEMKDVRIGLGAIEERPRRIPEAEAILEGAEPGPDAFAASAAAVADVIDPMEDAATSADYRRDLAGTVIRRALQSAQEQRDSQHG